MRKLVLAVMLVSVLTGCGSGDTTPDRPTAAKVVPIVIKDGAVTPQGKRVELKVGQDVTLRVTSDADEEIHVHSTPEHEFEVSSGTTGQDFTFAIETPGQVAVESHHLDVTIVQLVVRA